MNLEDVHQGVHGNRKRRRVGRGTGSGHGKTSTRGHKGAKSRAGYSRKPVFQGGAMPLVRRVPKRGFNNRFALVVAELNVSDLNMFNDGEDVTLELLRKKNLARGHFDVVKVLGDGELSKKLKVFAHRFSKSAAEKIQKAGGETVIVPGPTPVSDKQKAAREAKVASSKAKQ